MRGLQVFWLLIPLCVACSDGKSTDTADDGANGQVDHWDGSAPDDDLDADADGSTGDGLDAGADADADDGVAADADADADDGVAADADADADDGIEDADDADADADGVVDPECTEDAELALYERYIEPLVTDAHPSNCNSCHLSGVDLSMYIQDTPCQSMACMDALEVIDFEDPPESEILAYITMGDPTSDLIDEAVMEREHTAFLQWIEWGAECHEEVCGEITDPCTSGTDGTAIADGISTPLADCSEADLVDSFEALVIPHQGRCSSCHHVDGTDRSHFPDPVPGAFFWFGSDDDRTNAMMTMYNIIGMDLINLDSPPESRLLTKPLYDGMTQTVEGFGDIVGIEHAGGGKMGGDAPEDAMLDFVEWIQYYVECRGESATDTSD